MFDLNSSSWFIVGLCAFLVGVSKTGLPGLGILPIPLMAMVFSSHTRESTGILLGILILGDLFAAAYYRQAAEWGHVIRLLPPAFAGIMAGWQAMRFVTNEMLQPIMGVIVLAMLGVNYWRTRLRGEDAPVPTQWWFAMALGFVAGVTTMMANAAGPVMVIYLLAMRLPKLAFVGTSAWFFFAVNWLKVPFSANLDLITRESVRLDLMMLPLIAAGSVAGILFLRRIPQKAFNSVVQILAAAAAIKLLF
ncbi:MAG: sulfite exporter TauE/SafE family protein [Planctomycetaceae bacterium]|nr:MAG: sulfite exporter TauE/SafE family protein [Planctomycetaceae bacterium]